MCPLPPADADANPWSLMDDVLGTEGLPFLPNQIIGLGIVMLTVGAFSRQNFAVGLGVTVILTMFLTYLGWLSLDWTWLTLAFAVTILVALSIKKGEERTY